MKGQTKYWDRNGDLSRMDRIALHLRCLLRDHRCRWHLAGIWREVTLQ
jgi:hypothetical protein